MVICLFAVLTCGLRFAGYSTDLSLEDWAARQLWVSNVEAGLPRGVHLAISQVPQGEEGWSSFQIREVHEKGSGFDENVSPSLGLFRVDDARSMVEWLNPVSGEWDSLSAFLRELKSTPSVAGQSNMIPEPQTNSNGGAQSETEPVAFSRSDGRSLSADLDGDGKAETVRWLPIDSIDSDNYFYLEVVDDTGEVLWTGPKDRSQENAYVFFESHFGSSFPQLLTDIDGDRNVELLAPEPQSDVSATYFRRLTWRNGSFVPMSSAPLMINGAGGDEFVWLEGNYSLGTWVGQFGKFTDEGLVQARVTHYDEAGIWKGGAALLRFTDEGAVVEDWVQPLSENPTNMIPMGDSAGGSSEVPEGHFPLSVGIAVEYSKSAYEALKGAGSDVKISLIVDQYGPQYVEEEGVAYVDRNLRLGDVLEVKGIPLSNSAYRIQASKTYKLTVMVTPTSRAVPLLECYSAEGAVDWVVDEIQGRTLVFRCKLSSEAGDPEMIKGNSEGPGSGDASGLYDPFADVDMDLLFDD